MKSLFLLPLFVASLLAADVRLAWNANSEADLAGYRVYQSLGTNAFVRIASIPVMPAPTVLVTNIDSGVTNRFFVTAYNAAALESDPSNIVLVALPFSPTNLTATVQINLQIPLK